MSIWQFTKQNILPIFAGVICAVVTVAIIEVVGHAAYPPPVGVDLASPAEIARIINSAPFGALLFVVFAWGAGSFFGALVATLLSFRQSFIPGLTVGVFILAATLATLYAISHPVWMFVTGLIIPLPLAYLGIYSGHVLQGSIPGKG
ncbi:MAG: hypothetical protein ACRBBN_21950 [Methyloligellaceae bacterium]